ncbi:MAG: hypothetical protein JWL91_2730 [Sphingomonas bacterium]|jgi:ElaB/YqjD/DUF883 family membrane-anchored ribosome-binding protein|nr:hypothetical protein [Sphingomonas bacterium]MDB5690854.1 hypothetical protein [Sphingomonas bacterium]
MARSPDNLPEGTDSIIPGASATDLDEVSMPARPPYDPAGSYGSSGSSSATTSTLAGSGAADAALGLKDEARQVVSEKTAGLREQATDTVRTYALQGKEKATDALDNVIRMIDDAAAAVDDKVGPQYGDYVRQAGETLAGISSTLRDKDVDDLVDDARGVVRNSPALAIGAAAAVGFLVARIVKAGATPSTDTAEQAVPGTSTVA